MEGTSGWALILRASKVEDEDDDPYKKELQALGIRVQSVPVLSFEYCNLDVLKDHLQKHDEYYGIIFTSPRAVEAILQSIPDWNMSMQTQWKNHQHFAVGEATALSLSENIKLQSNGKGTGNALQLAELIIKCVPKNSKPLLFPCSSLRHETLPKLLQEAGILLNCITTYQTKPNLEMKTRIEKAVTDKGVPEYIVFFSPSGVKYAIPTLKDLLSSLTEVKLIAIGPSTEEALKKENLMPFCTAAQPSATGLRDAIVNATSKI